MRDCMNAEGPPFSKGTVVGFRNRLIEKNLDRRLVERTARRSTLALARNSPDQALAETEAAILAGLVSERLNRSRGAPHPAVLVLPLPAQPQGPDITARRAHHHHPQPRHLSITTVDQPKKPAEDRKPAL